MGTVVARTGRRTSSADVKTSDLRHHDARRCAAGGLEPLGAGQAAHRPAPRRPRRRLHRGRLAGRHPEGHRVLPSRHHESSPSSTPPWSPSARPDAPTRRPPRTRRCWRCGIRMHPWSAGRQEPRQARREGVAHDARGEPRDDPRHRGVPAQRGSRASSWTASTSSTATSTTPSTRLEVVRTAAEAGAEVVVLCDTNGGMLPHQVGDIVGKVLADTGAASASTRRTTPAAPSRTHRRGPRRRDAGAGHDERLRRAHRQREPDQLCRQPAAEARHAGAARGQAGRGHAHLARRR